jgi:hypothetical protein
MPYPGQGPQYRDRWLATLQFSHTDRVPLEPGNGRESTLKRWHAEGLPAGIAKGEEVSAVAYHQAGGREELPIPGDGFPVDFTCIPRFKEKIIEHRGATQIVQDWKGNVCEIGVEYETRHLRAGVDFVTRRWIRCPVESRSDWPSVARRYDARDSTRLPPDGESRAQRLHHRSWPVAISVPGPFWQLREWLGFEALCTLMYDDPQFLNEMLAFWSDFVFHMLQRTFSSFVPDEVHVSEDMAFKGFSMISPRMTCDFLLPIWSRWGNLVSCAGCPIYAIDSDGGPSAAVWTSARSPKVAWRSWRRLTGFGRSY